MSEELLVNECLREVRAARVANGVLRELFFEPADGGSLVGNIYKGRVARVLPGLQACFVNVGLERSAFLHASDIQRSLGDELPGQKHSRDIAELVREGDELLVQVLKDPMGGKGARLTPFITLPSRLLVFAPMASGVSVSARIGDQERERLRSLVESLAEEGDSGGLIVRTAARGASVENLRTDRQHLAGLWGTVRANAVGAGVGERVHRDLPLATRLLRDCGGDGLARVRVDSRAMYQRMRRYAEQFIPEMSDIIELHDGGRPLFDAYGIEDEISQALRRRVPLKSGGHLVIEQTEALTTIDVNSGRYVGRRDQEDTSLSTNLEAAEVIARQLRLRDLGGIIIVDFIDLDDEEHRRQLVDELVGHLSDDRGKTRVMNVSPLGLVEISRKRTRDSLERTLCRPCPTCGGRGFTKTPQTVCGEIFREILARRAEEDFAEVLVLAPPDVIGWLADEDAATVASLEDLTGASIRLRSERLQGPEQFDVVPN